MRARVAAAAIVIGHSRAARSGDWPAASDVTQRARFEMAFRGIKVLARDQVSCSSLGAFSYHHEA